MPKMIQIDRPCKDVVSLSIPTPFPVGDVNVYLLEGNELTLVDTGPNTEEAWEVLTSGIAAAGYRLSDLRQILLTHSHEDHTGLAYRLKKETGATILAHPDTVVWMKEESWFVEWRNRFYLDLYLKAGLDKFQIQKVTASFQAFRRFGHPCEVDVVLADGEFLHSHPEWQVLYTPGHSQTQISLYRPGDGAMLLADHLIAHISSNAFLEPSVRPEEERCKPLMQYREELKKLMRMPVSIGLPGHGVPILDHADLIERRLQSMERRAENIMEVLAAEELTALELALRLFPQHHNQLPLILSETLGHLDWLEAAKHVRKESRDGIEYYSA